MSVILKDIRELSIDKSLPLTERMSVFLMQIGNPQVFKVGDTMVKIEYGSKKSFQEAMTSLLNAG